jgi:colanic acid/amylovoran biosynthesis glycosyltransferase
MRTINTVLIFKSFLLPYSETFIAEQAGNCEGYSPCYVGFGLMEGIRLPAGSTIVATASRTGGRILFYAALFGWNGFRKKKRDLKALNARLVHAHFENEGIRALPLARLTGLPLLVTCHGNDVTSRQAFWRNLLLGRRQRLLHRRAAGFIAVSRFIQNAMILRGYPRDKIHLHYIGIDVEKFKRDSSIPREPVVLFVGRLVEKKGCADLMHAMALAAREGNRAKLVIIGDGPLREELKALQETLGIDAVFLGRRSPEEVKNWMNRAMIFSMPSVQAKDGDSEGLGMVFCEAQAMELPVVSTRHGGIPEVVLHGETGLLAEERSPGQLAEHLSTLLKDSGLRERYGKAGREHMASRFNLRSQCRKLEEIYALYQRNIGAS